MKIIVAHTRTFKDRKLFKKLTDLFLKKSSSGIVLFSRGEPDDFLTEEYARAGEIPVEMFVLDPGRWGKSAEYKRTRDMVSNANALLCFWDGCSVAEKYLIDLATEYHLERQIVRVR